MKIFLLGTEKDPEEDPLLTKAEKEKIVKPTKKNVYPSVFLFIISLTLFVISIVLLITLLLNVHSGSFTFSVNGLFNFAVSNHKLATIMIIGFYIFLILLGIFATIIYFIRISDLRKGKNNNIGIGVLNTLSVAISIGIVILIFLNIIDIISYSNVLGWILLIWLIAACTFLILNSYFVMFLLDYTTSNDTETRSEDFSLKMFQTVMAKGRFNFQQVVKKIRFKFD